MNFRKFLLSIIGQTLKNKHNLLSFLSFYICSMHSRIASMQNSQSSLESSLLDTFTKLKDSLSESNMINIGNMHGFTINFGILTEYVKDAFKSMIRLLYRYQESNHYLRGVIHRNGLDHLLEGQHKEEDIKNQQLAELNRKINQHIVQKNQSYDIVGVAERNQEENSKKWQENRKKRRIDHSAMRNKGDGSARKEQRQKSQLQVDLAIRYIRNDLRDKLEWDPSAKPGLSKAFVMNLFLKWVDAAPHQERLIDPNIGKIQMVLTNQLKHCFPHMTHTDGHFFRGLKIKTNNQQLLEPIEQRSLRGLKVFEEDEDSEDFPTLTFFDEENQVDYM